MNPYINSRAGNKQPPKPAPRTAGKQPPAPAPAPRFDHVNAPRFGGHTSTGGQQTGRDQVFNRAGSINADSKHDALVQIAHILQQAAGGNFRPQAQQMSREERDERMKTIAAAIQDPTGEGFAIVGQELLLPIKSIVDYEGWARKVYRVRPLGQGELFRIAKDVRATAWVIGQDGQSIESRLSGKYIQPSEFKVASFPTVDIQDIYHMNYDVLDRAQDTARQEIELHEDKRGLALLDRAANAVNDVTLFPSLGIAAFEDVRFQVERHRLIVEKFLIARSELSDIVKNMSTAVDPVTERELILAGYIGNILNSQIITTAGTGVQEVVPAGTFYAVTGSDYLGEMGVRVEMFSEPFNKYAQGELVKGWAFGEIIGFGIPEPKAVAKGMKLPSKSPVKAHFGGLFLCLGVDEGLGVVKVTLHTLDEQPFTH